MGIRMINTPISDTLATSTLECISYATIAAGVPVGIYIDSSGIRKARKITLASTAVNFGISINSATESAQVVNVCVGGLCKVAKTAGTTGQFITGIGIAGTCTTAAIASANVGLRSVLGMKKSTYEVILY
jgi:hypothetical protein